MAWTAPLPARGWATGLASSAVGHMSQSTALPAIPAKSPTTIAARITRASLGRTQRPRSAANALARAGGSRPASGRLRTESAASRAAPLAPPGEPESVQRGHFERDRIGDEADAGLDVARRR